ncbi:MAG: IS630 family transposase [Deinococcota bacterium]
MSGNHQTLQRRRTSGLVDRRLGCSGRKPLLSDDQMLHLAQCIRKDYAQGIYWNGAKVVIWINEELGKQVHEQRAYEYLKAIGMSLQQPRPRHARADPAAQERFKKGLPEALQAAQALHGEVEVWTTDEHRLGLQPILKRLWAPCGQRPHIAIYPRYEWPYLYAFVQPASGASQWFIMPRLNCDVFAIALAQVAATTDKHILLVIDNAAWHRSSKLAIPDNSNNQ